MSQDIGPWGDRVSGGRANRVLRRLAATLGLVMLVLATAGATTVYLLVERAEANLTRIAVPELDAPASEDPTSETSSSSSARSFLLVGSDSREGLDAAQRQELSLGTFDGQRSDTMIYVSVSADRSEISLVSLPRDLLVIDDGQQRKLTDTFARGPDNLVRIIQENFGLPVNHYAEVTVSGFLDVVDTLGGVELCLDEPLVDRRAGADLDAGCLRRTPEEALAFSRSRQGPRGDLERVERQQTFLRAVLSELVQTRVLADVPRLFDLVDDLASSVTTDENLSITEMRSLADELRQVVRDGIPMTTVPGYSARIDGIWYLVAYEPGARALFEDLRAGRPVADRGSPQQREDTRVAIWSGGRGTATGRVAETLLYAGFTAGGAGQGPAELHADAVTTVYRLPGRGDQADWVAATLGAPIVDLPADATAPEGADVVVAVGDDAAG